MSRYIILHCVSSISYFAIHCYDVLKSQNAVFQQVTQRLWVAPGVHKERAVCAFKSKAVQRRPFTMNTLRPFVRSGTTRPNDTAVTSWQNWTYRNVAVWNPNHALLDMVHTDTSTNQLGPETKKKSSADQMWVVQTPNTYKYYIHSLHTDGTLT